MRVFQTAEIYGNGSYLPNILVSIFPNKTEKSYLSTENIDDLVHSHMLEKQLDFPTILNDGNGLITYTNTHSTVLYTGMILPPQIFVGLTE